MKNKTTAGLLALFLGWFGVHRFYLGQTGRGILYLLFSFTVIPLIIALVDGIIFLTQSEEDFNKKYNPEVYYANLYGVQTQHRAPSREDVAPPQYAPPPAAPQLDPFRVSGDQKYADYDFEGAMQDYRRSLNVDPRQGEVHFKLAALHSIYEDTSASLRHLSLALENGYYDFDTIEKDDHLAYLRSTPEWLAFKSNGYRLPPAQATAPAKVTEEPPTETLELSDDLITRIERLARLKDDGILTEESFQREKAKILRS